MEQVARGLRRWASAMAEGERQPSKAPTARTGRVALPQGREVALLWKRLGAGNREFLGNLAVEYKPGETFTLGDVARDLRIKRGSARARMANIGRSLNALGG